MFASELFVTLLFKVFLHCLERRDIYSSPERGINKSSSTGSTGKYYYYRVGGHWKIIVASDWTADVWFCWVALLDKKGTLLLKYNAKWTLCTWPQETNKLLCMLTVWHPVVFIENFECWGVWRCSSHLDVPLRVLRMSFQEGILSQWASGTS